MKFRVIGGPLTNAINVEAKHSDNFKSIFKKVQKTVGKKVQLDGYGLFTSKSEATGQYAPAAGPLNSADTPDSVQLDRERKEPHVLLLVPRAECGDGGSSPCSLSHSNSVSDDTGDLGSQEATSSTSMPSPMATPRSAEGYRRRILAMFLKYDPEKANKVDLALQRYAGYEEDVIQQLVKRYGPEPTADEVETPSTPASASKKPIDGFSYRDRLVAMYSTYEPVKLSKVDGTLRRYAGREEEVIQQLVKKYGPEPQRAAAARATSITMSEAPPPTPPYELTPMADNGSSAAAMLTPSSAPVVAALATPRGALTYRDRLTAMYATYDPRKIRLVDGTLKKYKGREEAVLKQLVKMYGPEPSPEDVAAAKEAAVSMEQTRKDNSDGGAGSSSSFVVEGSRATTNDVVETPRAALPSVAVKATAVVAVPVVAEVVAVPQAEKVHLETALDVSATSSPPEKPIENGKTTESIPSASEVKDTVKGKEEEGGRYRERLVALYCTYNPNKLHTVEGTLKKFAGKEEAAIQQLVRRYGPEPPALTKEQAYELLKSVSGTSPVSSPRSAQNFNANAAQAESSDNALISSPNSSKPASPMESTPGDLGNYRERIRAVFAAHDPEKVDKVELILASYQGKEEEMVAKLEQRYDLHQSDKAELSKGSTLLSSVGALVLEEGAGASVVVSPSPQRTPTPPPEQVAVTTAILSSMPLGGEAVTVVSEDGATRPTAPPSQCSSSPDSNKKTPVEQEKAHPESMKEVAPSTVSTPVNDLVPVPTPIQLSPDGTPGRQPSPPPQQQQLTLRPRNYVAIATVAAGHLELLAQKTVRQRYWTSWCRHHVEAKADSLVQDELWVEATTASSSLANGQVHVSAQRYQLNDAVQPPYMVTDLSTIAAQEDRRTAAKSVGFSSEVEIAARTLLSALRHCVESRIVEVRSSEEEELANRFLMYWKTAGHLCPVKDSPEFARALHQAAHLIAQLDDLMTVIRAQAGQLQQLKSLHKDVLQRMEALEASSGDVERLQAELDSANGHRRKLEEELKHATAQAGVSAQSQSGVERKTCESKKALVRTPRVYPTTEERKDAQIAKLQQELAKTRNSLFASKEAEEKLKLQLLQSAARETRREHGERRREGPPGYHSRPVSVSPQSRSHSSPGGQRARNPSKSSSPRRGYPTSSTPRGAFSHAILPGTPRRPSEPGAQVTHNGHAMSSIRKSALDSQDRSNLSVNNTPWPVSRFVVTEEVERGPCPNCLTPLTSCSAEVKGLANEKAAFCFSCRRSFTFGELRARDIRDTLEHL